MVILNKVGAAAPNQVDAARKIIRSLNADARIIETDYSNAPADAILDTGLFDFQKAHEHPTWAKELYGFADHAPETEGYGVASVVYRARRPFVPEKLMAVLNGEMPGVIRAKGLFWIATRPNWVAEFSLAGALSSMSPMGRWWASAPRDSWPDNDGVRAYIKQHWSEPWGDRRQEIVFIGSGIDWPTLRARLDDALLPETMADGPDSLADGPDSLPDLPDPFPAWQATEAAA